MFDVELERCPLFGAHLRHGDVVGVQGTEQLAQVVKVDLEQTMHHEPVAAVRAQALEVAQVGGGVGGVVVDGLDIRAHGQKRSLCVCR